MFGAFVLASALAGALGAANLGTALAFGQIAFALARRCTCCVPQALHARWHMLPGRGDGLLHLDRAARSTRRSSA